MTKSNTMTERKETTGGRILRKMKNLDELVNESTASLCHYLEMPWDISFKFYAGSGQDCFVYVSLWQSGVVALRGDRAHDTESDHNPIKFRLRQDRLEIMEYGDYAERYAELEPQLKKWFKRRLYI